ncbi:hypothetical protein AAY473_039507 [Plecturocebus cupreus]
MPGAEFVFRFPAPLSSPPSGNPRPSNQRREEDSWDPLRSFNAGCALRSPRPYFPLEQKNAIHGPTSSPYLLP